MSLPLQMIQEGTTETFVYSLKDSTKGPACKQDEPFYNPAMELNRDLSVVFMDWFIGLQKKQAQVLDGLAASGIRGVRFAKELSGDFTVVINDRDVKAFSLIQKNIEHHKLTNAQACNDDLQNLLVNNRYQYIDIDPFGSPIYYLSNAVQSITNNGVIACTATDTATLCGVYPKVCIRRYAATPYHSVVMHEIGLRILLGALGRDAARYDKGIEPLLCYVTDHYFRLYVQIKKGKEYADQTMHQIVSLSSDQIPMNASKEDILVGPLWMGCLQNQKILSILRTSLFERSLHTKHGLWKLLSLLEEESTMPAFFYASGELASMLKVSAPSMKEIFESLKNQGYQVTRTHFLETGFKTNAPYSSIKQVFKKTKTIPCGKKKV